jgi:ParB-like chromosome segregation protein Spo0J
MNAYTTRDQDRMQPHDFAAVTRTNPFMTGSSLAAFERQRSWQADAEVARLLKQHGVTPQAHALVVALLRLRIGAALVRAGDRLADVPGSGVSPEPAPTGTQEGTPAW